MLTGWFVSGERMMRAFSSPLYVLNTSRIAWFQFVGPAESAPSAMSISCFASTAGLESMPPTGVQWYVTDVRYVLLPMLERSRTSHPRVSGAGPR